MIPVHLMGWMLGIVGLGGVLPGVVYPVVLLVLLRRWPNLGAPVLATDESGRERDTASPTHGHQRQAVYAHVIA